MHFQLSLFLLLYLLLKNMCTLYKHIFSIPATVTSDLNLKQHIIDTWASISQNVIEKKLVNGESSYMQAWRQNDITLNTPAKLKPALFRANTLYNQLFSVPAVVYREKWRDKESWIRISFLKSADAVDQKLSKLVYACWNCSLLVCWFGWRSQRSVYCRHW